MNKKTFWLMLILAISTPLGAQPISTNFTYQGQLKISNSLANGSYDFQFTAFEDDGLGVNSGSSIASTQMTGVIVTNGVFTTQLDFSGMVFQGNKIWLEIAVRTNGSTGGFQQLLPRQEVTPAPYAIQSQFVSANAITGVEIANGSIGSSDLGTNSVTSNSLANNAVGTLELANNAVTASKLADNAVDTAAIQDNVIISTKIADNSITAADLAINSVQASEIAANAVGSSEVISSQVQLRVNSTCEENYAMVGINTDGSVVCRRIPVSLDYVLQTTISNSFRFYYTSIAISPISGHPLIAYHYTYGTSLNLYVCNNKSCSSGYVRVLDNTGLVGTYNSMAIRANGNPIISYFDGSNANLKVYDCNNSTCSSGTARTLYSTGNTGSRTSITIDPNTDRPIISYRDGSALRVYACADNQCTSGLYNGIKDSTADTFDTDIAINPVSGYAQIAYFDSNNGDLKLYTCTNAVCSSGSTRIIDDGGTDIVGKYPSIAYVPGTDRAEISYYDSTNGNLKFAYCTNNICSTKSIVVLDAVDDVGQYTNTVYNPSIGTMMISYSDYTNGNLKVFVCKNSTCTTQGTATTVDADDRVGSYASMALGTDGIPIISYTQDSFYSKRLKVFSCGDVNCQR